jgi:glycosyltransferase involved in cell wall biosynthesis
MEKAVAKVPELTVLMPVYNAGKYLSQAMDSVLNQTFRNFEFLIIDDGSTDNSIEIIKSYNDSRIRLEINEKNLGISATLNKGIEMASCELIARMDADDISYPQRLQVQYDYFRKFPDTVLLSASVRIIDDENKLVENVELDHFFNCFYLNFICAQYHPTIMYRRSVLLSIGAYSVPYSEDFDLWWRIMVGNYKLGHINEILVDYRKSETSLSQVLKKKEYDAANDALLIRNIHYYTGPGFNLSGPEIKFLQHIYDPLLELGSVSAIIKSFKKLRFISGKILEKPNVSYKPNELVPYVKLKKDHAFSYYYIKLPRIKAFRLLFSIYSPKESLQKIWPPLKRKLIG